MDLEQPHPTDLRDRMIQEHIINDVLNSKYDYIHLGTPCNTYSALREIPPGPRPLRSADEIMGISEGLTQKEKEDLKEGNLHTEFSGRVMEAAEVSYTPFSLENPEPQNEVTIFNTPVMAPFMKKKEASMANFDQCRYGCETTKPTRLLAYLMDVSAVDEVRCNHPKQDWVDAKGKKYSASHERVAGWKEENGTCAQSSCPLPFWILHGTSQHGVQSEDNEGQAAEEAGKGDISPLTRHHL